jgi:hypothetical protein
MWPDLFSPASDVTPRRPNGGGGTTCELRRGAFATAERCGRIGKASRPLGLSILPVLNTPVIYGDGWKMRVDILRVACRRAGLCRGGAVDGVEKGDKTGAREEKSNFGLYLQPLPPPFGTSSESRIVSISIIIFYVIQLLAVDFVPSALLR